MHSPPYDLNPFRAWTKDDAGDQRARPLVVAVEGQLSSQFGESNGGEPKPARVVVAGGSSFVKDQFLAEGNQALFLNMLDWLVRDDALLAVRTRGLSAAPLGEVSDSARMTIRYANTLGVPLLCIASGLIRWRRRESRRARVELVDLTPALERERTKGERMSFMQDPHYTAAVNHAIGRELYDALLAGRPRTPLTSATAPEGPSR